MGWQLKLKRFVGIILVNPEAKVLLQLRSEGEAYYPGCWTLPGGMIEENESPEHALRREIKEELGVNLFDYELLQKIIEKTPDEIVERYIYRGNIEKGIEDLKLGEGSALKYFSHREIPTLKIAFDLKSVIEEFMFHASS